MGENCRMIGEGREVVDTWREGGGVAWVVHGSKAILKGTTGQLH